MNNFKNVNEFVYQLWSCETEEEVIQLLKEMSRSTSKNMNIQKPIFLNDKNISNESDERNSMIINCWINGVYKEMSLDEVIESFKELNAKKIN